MISMDGADRCSCSVPNAELKERITQQCENRACTDEFKDCLFPHKFIRIKYICEGIT